MARRKIALSANVDAKLKELAAKARGSVEVGWINTDQAQIAFWNEFGHKGRFPAPARPFFRTMVAKESPKWPQMMATELKRSDFNGARTLKYMGEEMDGQLKESIRNTNTPPLSPVTLRLRLKFGNNPQNISLKDVFSAIGDVRSGKAGATGTQAKPLIWTGQMINSTGYKVTGGE